MTDLFEVRTKSVYYDEIDKRKSPDADGYRVLIMRYWPRPLTQRQVSAKKSFIDLSPSRKLLADWKDRATNGMSWSDYTKRFLEEYTNNPIAQTEIEFLRNKLKTSHVTLLCREESSDPHCHRYIVKALIEDKISFP